MGGEPQAPPPLLDLGTVPGAGEHADGARAAAADDHLVDHDLDLEPVALRLGDRVEDLPGRARSPVMGGSRRNRGLRSAP